MFECKVSAKILDEYTSARTRKMASLFKGYSYDRGRTGDDTMRTQEKILLEQALAEALKKQQAEQWLAENSKRLPNTSCSMFSVCLGVGNLPRRYPVPHGWSQGV